MVNPHASLAKFEALPCIGSWFVTTEALSGVTHILHQDTLSSFSTNGTGGGNSILAHCVIASIGAHNLTQYLMCCLITLLPLAMAYLFPAGLPMVALIAHLYVIHHCACEVHPQSDPYQTWGPGQADSVTSVTWPWLGSMIPTAMAGPYGSSFHTLSLSQGNSISAALGL